MCLCVRERGRERKKENAGERGRVCVDFWCGACGLVRTGDVAVGTGYEWVGVFLGGGGIGGVISVRMCRLR